MNPNHIMPTSFRHNLEGAALGLPDEVALSFLWTRLAEEGRNRSAWPAAHAIGLEGAGGRAVRDRFLLSRKWPPSDRSKHPMGKTVMGLSSSGATGLWEAIPQSRMTVGSGRGQMGFGWLGRRTR